MPYPKATDADSAFFQQHGWIAVTDAIDPVDLEEVIRRCDEILANTETMAYDWAWEKGTSLEERDFKIVQSSPTKFWPDLDRSRFRRWAIEFGSDLMGEPIEFWYDQFLAKPPARGAATLWHQDEGYWGRNLADRGMTCWMPFHDVDERKAACTSSTVATGMGFSITSTPTTCRATSCTAGQMRLGRSPFP